MFDSEEGQNKSMGFYTTRWFEAQDFEEAELIAVDMIKK